MTDYNLNCGSPKIIQKHSAMYLLGLLKVDD